jgi:hypothetical protein
VDRSRALTRKSRLGDPDQSFERMLRDRTTASERFAETWRHSESGGFLDLLRALCAAEARFLVGRR